MGMVGMQFKNQLCRGQPQASSPPNYSLPLGSHTGPQIQDKAAGRCMCS